MKLVSIVSAILRKYHSQFKALIAVPFIRFTKTYYKRQLRISSRKKVSFEFSCVKLCIKNKGNTEHCSENILWPSTEIWKNWNGHFRLQPWKGLSPKRLLIFRFLTLKKEFFQISVLWSEVSHVFDCIYIMASLLNVERGRFYWLLRSWKFVCKK